uniref:PNPLA domain-containing protein n=1 Tax=Salarias fasciatus TaxID=181472 RepID=A0A672J3U3_SALFA
MSIVDWNISFAGCGFRSIYYVGALSCILERAPHLVDGASKICGASSGCLVAAALAVGIPIGESHLWTAQASLFLLFELPQDAHRRASGRLCVSLTRMSDMKNVLVSEFDRSDQPLRLAGIRTSDGSFSPTFRCASRDTPSSWLPFQARATSVPERARITLRRSTTATSAFRSTLRMCITSARPSFLPGWRWIQRG